MAEIDVAQIQRMMRAVLRSADAGMSSRASPAASEQEIAPHAARSVAPPRGPRASGRSADTVRLSGEGLRRLADAVLRALAQAFRPPSDAGPDAPNAVPAPSPARAGPDAPAAPPVANLSFILADEGLREQVVRIFSQPEVVSRIPEFLRDPRLADITIRLLAQLEVADPHSPSAIARSILAREDASDVVSTLLQNSSSRAQAIRFLFSSRDGVAATLEILARPEMLETAQRVFRIIARPDNVARVPQLLGNDATRGAVLEILARVAPGTEQAAIVAGVLSDPQAVETLTRLFLSAPLPAEAPGLPFETSEALRILGWPEMANVAKQVFQSAEARAALARILTVVPSPSAQTESSPPPGRPAPTPDHIASIVRMLARPEMAQAAQQVFAFADARNALIA
ncbi:MAG TPA: hypothetical protein VM492_16950, partial [Sumerlaeia bacterium]|nr:hypothetical protein [Sumerlaeia bacterium]